MKLSRPSHTRLKKSLPCREEGAQTGEAAAEVVALEVAAEVKVEGAVNKNPWERNILIYHQGSGMGALCTENGGGGLISVPNPPPAHGRTSSLQKPRIETGTSPENQ